MNDFSSRLQEIARLLIQGRIGDANSLWGAFLPTLSNFMRNQKPEFQERLLPALRQILACQQQKDWIGMSDGLRYGLLPLVEGHH
ncbi:MAG TPA: hypothetical protein VLM37_04745 [Fibrobacteraceae bacterium]|nr:hypothetical protein [Fibrobacteraceae bacterium]